MKHLFYFGKLKFFSEDELHSLAYQEILSLCIETARQQRKILMEDVVSKKERLYYGRPVVASMEASISFVEEFFPDIRRTIRNSIDSVVRKRN